VIGDPTGATREQGEEILDTLSDSWVQASPSCMRCAGWCARAHLGRGHQQRFHPAIVLCRPEARSLHRLSSFSSTLREVPTMRSFALSRRRIAACRPPGRRPAQAQDKFTYMTNWYAQAEHGGFYQAVATGIYKKYGLDVTIKMGGPQVNIMQLMAAGQADCIMGSSDIQMMQVREGGLPVVNRRGLLPEGPAGADRARRRQEASRR
jgi:hypothetical protein